MKNTIDWHHENVGFLATVTILSLPNTASMNVLASGIGKDSQKPDSWVVEWLCVPWESGDAISGTKLILQRSFDTWSLIGTVFDDVGVFIVVCHPRYHMYHVNHHTHYGVTKHPTFSWCQSRYSSFRKNSDRIFMYITSPLIV